MSNKLYTCMCERCGKEYTAKRKGSKYCSEDCCRAADRDNKRIKYVGKRQSVCARCGKPLPKFKTLYCSNACCRGSGTHVKKCAMCGKEFITTRLRTLTCSEHCSKRYDYSKKPSRTERYKDITIDKDITLEKLSVRDGGVCQICGEPVNWDDKKTINGLVLCGNYYPSIDHVTPISKGGLHSWDNVQLAHRICNSLKCDKVI